MANYPSFPKQLELPADLSLLILEAAAAMAQQSHAAFRVGRRPVHGGTLRPGKETPLWNALRAQIRPYLTKRGDQAKLGRLLGLPRQRVQAFATAGSQMPDAERTLQLLAWLSLVRQGWNPS
jgi:hypothetical protein